MDLQDEDSEVFARYLNCVYFGIDALQLDANAPEDDDDDGSDNEELLPDAFLCLEAEFSRLYQEETSSRGKYSKYIHQCLDIFADLYLLADRLRDVETANLVMDALICFSDKGRETFETDTIRRVYDSTAHGNPLRKYMRDECVYETKSRAYMDFQVAGYHPELARDAMVEFLRAKDFNGKGEAEDVYDEHGRLADKCRYHQHDETHPRCVAEPEKKRKPPTEPMVSMGN